MLVDSYRLVATLDLCRAFITVSCVFNKLIYFSTKTIPNISWDNLIPYRHVVSLHLIHKSTVYLNCVLMFLKTIIILMVKQHYSNRI